MIRIYCKHCGARADEERASDPAARYQRAMTRKRIIIMAAIAACLILLFAGYKTGEALTSKEKLISDFEAALDQKDAKKAAKLLQSSDVDLAVTEKNVKPLLDYLTAAVFFAYFVLMTKYFGQTLGKMVFGLKVVGRQQGRAGKNGYGARF